MIRMALFSLVFACVAHGETLKVGMAEAPPFSWTDDQGAWQGVAVELWKQAATDAGVEWTAIKVERVGMLVDQLGSGAIDVAVTGLTVTPDRAERIDFLPTFEVTSIGMAVAETHELEFAVLLEALADSAFLGLSLVVVSLALLFGVAIWLVERRDNCSEFGGKHHHGLGSGLWWSMVTMSTVGYGDKSPRTLLGRAVAGIWIVLALVLVSVFTGAAASAFTQHTSAVTASTWELRGKKVGAIDGGETQRWLKSKGINAQGFASIESGLTKVTKGELDAFVGDVTTLRWTVLDKYIEGITIRGGLRPERLALAVRPGLEQERELNVALLRAMQSAQWSATLQAHGWPSQGLVH